MLQEGKWGVNVGNKDRTDIVKVKTLLRAAGLPPNALDAAMSDRVRRHPFRTSAIIGVCCAATFRACPALAAIARRGVLAN